MSDYGLPYRGVTLPAFPDAAMVVFDVGGPAAIGLGAHQGLADGTRRIVSAHQALSRDVAAERVAAARADTLGDLLKGYRGFRGMRDAHGRTADASPEIVARAMVEALSTRDAYRAARLVEERSGVDADTALVDLMREAVLRMETMALRDDIGAEAALIMERGVPGPGTMLSRMLSEWRGMPAPSPEGIVHVPPPRDMQGWSCAVIGTLVVTPGAGADRWSGGSRPVEVTVRALVDPGSVEAAEDGSLAEASVRLDVVYDPATHDAGRDGHLYGDEATQSAVRSLLARHGLPGDAAWSESGRQDWRFGDMDVDAAIVPALWPDLVPPPPDGGIRP